MARVRVSELRRGDLVYVRGTSRWLKDVRAVESARGQDLVLVFETGAPVRMQPTDTVEASPPDGQRGRR